MPHNSNYRSPPLLAALAVAVLVGFLVPRPSFVDTLMTGNMETFPGSGAGELPGKAFAKGAEEEGVVAVSKPVNVSFYGESLCPDCRHMIMDVLDPLFKNGVSKLFELRYIAYGNVKGTVDSKEGIQCQHGPKECLYNRYINCAQSLLGYDQDAWFPYVKCMANDLGQLDSTADGCASDVGLEPEVIAECAQGQQGDKLEVQAAMQTNDLSPKHTFVPWVSLSKRLQGRLENLHFSPAAIHADRC